MRRKLGEGRIAARSRYMTGVSHSASDLVSSLEACVDPFISHPSFKVASWCQPRERVSRCIAEGSEGENISGLSTVALAVPMSVSHLGPSSLFSCASSSLWNLPTLSSEDTHHSAYILEAPPSNSNAWEREESRAGPLVGASGAYNIRGRKGRYSSTSHGTYASLGTPSLQLTPFKLESRARCVHVHAPLRGVDASALYSCA
ncbi:hypothetical protein BDN70DRAFT_892831 [Pholiota conissans]|uniref:Uncharacterized protein n=1 Tax=Pholiota conissans TaxID=109636 RepID=A0A9P5Z5Z0_9AGAR|nr:hypothetical protein BDN70DRAFT_892831 [Pholiota conissans]